MGCLPGLAATYTVPALTGASIQATINTAAGAGSNNTVALPAGLYNVASSISVPCSNGLTVTGPVATPATAVLNATFGGNDVFTMGGCSGVTIEYLQFKNTGGIYVANGNYSGITITHNQFLGLPSSVGGTSNASAAIYLDGNTNSTAQNINVTYNTFGDAGSCSAVFASNADQGGYCVGFYEAAGQFLNATIQHNYFFHMEEGLHLHQNLSNGHRGDTNTVVGNVSIQYNYVLNWHRIAMEIQPGVINSAILVSDNVILDPINPMYGTFGISMACCTNGRIYQNSTPPNPPELTNDNVVVTNVHVVQNQFQDPPYGIEYWGGAGSQADNNLVEGPFGQSITWGYGTAPWYIQNNYLCGPNPAGSYITNEEGSNTPTISGNTTTATCTQQTSTAPTLSPAAGAYTSPPLITMSNAGTNTSTYYTTDGSTPVPGSGTTQLYTGPFAITLPITIKSVGMWGVAPQPLSYAAPYGYVPSAVVTASYTATGGVTLASVALSNVGTVHSLVAGGSIQMTATCTYSDGSTTNCNAADAHGNSVSSWNSTNAAVTLSGSGLATGAAVGSANLSATVAGLTTPVWGMTVTAASVSLKSVSLSTTGGVSSIAVGAVNQLIATCAYSDSSTTSCGSADSHGNAVNQWNSTAPAVATASNSGVVTGVAAGSTSLTASVTPSGGSAVVAPSLPLTVTGAAPTLVSAYLGTVGNANTMTVGGTLQFSAYCVYASGPTQDCSVADIYGNAVTAWITSDATLVTIGAPGTASAGLATAIAAGAPNIKAHIGSLGSSQWNLTVSNPTVTLTGISLATTAGITGLFVGMTNALVATCIYSDGSSTNCTTTDSHGNLAGSYSSSTPAHATVNATTGLVSGVAPGGTTLAASAGGFTSMGIPLTVLAVPSGTYNITITGPVSFSGRVQF